MYVTGGLIMGEPVVIHYTAMGECGGLSGSVETSCPILFTLDHEDGESMMMGPAVRPE